MAVCSVIIAGGILAELDYATGKSVKALCKKLRES